MTWLEPMRSQLDQVAAASSAALQDDLRAAQVRGQRERTALAVVLFVVFGLAAFAVLWLNRGLAEPLRRLEAAARRFGRGDPTYPLEVTGPHELSQVATAFRGMAGQLSAKRAQLEH